MIFARTHLRARRLALGTQSICFPPPRSYASGREHENAPKHREAQKSKPLNPRVANSSSTFASDMPKVGVHNPPPEMISAVDPEYIPQDAGVRGSTNEASPDLGVGEMEGAQFKIEPLRRTGEDANTMRARLQYQSRKRGILETDLLMSTFAALYLGKMSRAQLEQYDRFLDENDWDIYYWATQEPAPTSLETAEGAVDSPSTLPSRPRNPDEWAQTVGAFKPAYRPVPPRWQGSEILSLLRQHVANSTATGVGSRYVFPDPTSLTPSHLLTLLPTTPPSPSLAIGTTPLLPPTPTSLRPNPHFLSLLHAVIRTHAHADPDLISAAQALASSAGSTLGAHRAPRHGPPHSAVAASGGGGGGGASNQGGAGGGGVGGWIHVSDSRAPVDFGRIAWPEDIFGSVEVDRQGAVREGTYQPCGTYRLVTRDGILGLSPFLRGMLVKRLEREEAALRAAM
ncbi:MAG: succinate dehydrogenase assembly factor 2 [Trizodia sp. TS-e1964]|nr:MAG: succinate dehydrogenase assembly factor 2 [Trizodia sp. TS-e1964]